MNIYKITLKYSKNRKIWTGTTKTIKAETDMSAIKQVESMYEYVKDIKILSVK